MVFVRLPDSWSNWNVKTLLFEEKDKFGVPAVVKLLGAK